MIDDLLRAHLEYILCIKIRRIIPVSGGDTSKAYTLQTDTERFFCKTHNGKLAFDLLQKEVQALNAIASTNTIATPRVIRCEAIEDGAYLLLEFISAKQPTAADMQLLGHQLAGLHQHGTHDNFGWQTHNFIGTLKQDNGYDTDWNRFYVERRLMPQFKLAVDTERLGSGSLPTDTALDRVCGAFFTDGLPRLIHGDLWIGNVIISETGIPVLIDPASYYGHAEVDIAMARLFGGFHLLSIKHTRPTFHKRTVLKLEWICTNSITFWFILIYSEQLMKVRCSVFLKSIFEGCCSSDMPTDLR